VNWRQERGEKRRKNQTAAARPAKKGGNWAPIAGVLGVGKFYRTTPGPAETYMGGDETSGRSRVRK